LNTVKSVTSAGTKNPFRHDFGLQILDSKKENNFNALKIYE
jgi:hypothetical protein